MTIPHSEDVPTVQTAGSQMSFVLQPFNYFDEDPSQDASDALSVHASTDTGTLVYHRRGDVTASRDLDCLPVMVRKSSCCASARYDAVTVLVTVTVMTACYWA